MIHKAETKEESKKKKASRNKQKQRRRNTSYYHVVKISLKVKRDKKYVSRGRNNEKYENPFSNYRLGMRYC